MKIKKSMAPLLIILLFSCATSSPRNRGSLSGAMDKSRDDYQEERTVPDKPDAPGEEAPRTDEPGNREEQENETPPEEAMGAPSEPVKLMVLFRGGSGFAGGPYYTPRFNGELLIGDTLGQGSWEVFLFGGFNHLTTKPSHKIFKSIKPDSYTLNAGIEGRFYPLPGRTFFSPCVMGRIGGMILFWQFKNPLTVGLETISSDSLGGLLLGVGAGVDFIHTENFKLGVAFIPETYIFGDETSQGFTNDFFNTQGILRLAVEGGLRF